MLFTALGLASLSVDVAVGLAHAWHQFGVRYRYVLAKHVLKVVQAFFLLVEVVQILRIFLFFEQVDVVLFVFHHFEFFHASKGNLVLAFLGWTLDEAS